MNRLVGLHGEPIGGGGDTPPQGQGIVGGRVQIRPSRKPGEPRDYLFEAEFVLEDGDAWVRSARLLAQLYVALGAGITLRSPVVKVRVFADKAFGPLVAPYFEKLMGKAEIWRTFTAPDDPPPDQP